MRLRISLVAVAVMAVAVVVAPAQAAMLRLDPTFGHRGRLVRSGGLWAHLVGQPLPRARGGLLMQTDDGRVVAVDRRWRVDHRYGTSGIVRTGLVQARMQPRGRGVLLDNGELYPPGPFRAVTLDAHGSATSMGDALTAVVNAETTDGILAHHLVVADGQIADPVVEHHPVSDPQLSNVSWRLDLLTPAGAVSKALPWGCCFSDAAEPVAAGSAIVLAAYGRMNALLRVRLDGTADMDYGANGTVEMPDTPVTILPWRQGGVVVVGSTFLTCVDGQGQVLARRQLPSRLVAAAVDRTGGVLLAFRFSLRHEQRTRGVELERYTAAGRADGHFGHPRLVAPHAVGWGAIVVRDKRRIDVEAATVREVPDDEPYSRGDLVTLKSGTVVWRLRAR